MAHGIITLTLVAGWLLVPLFGQGPTERKTNLLPPDAPELYRAFLHFHDELSAVVQERKTLDPLVGAKVEKGIARDYGISVDDLGKVTAVAHSLVADLTSWKSDVKSRVEEAHSKGERPAPESMRQLRDRRQQLIETARQRLSTDLSAGSWAALRAYINNVHRQHVTVLSSKDPTAGQVQ
jgi:hypothetical protein